LRIFAQKGEKSGMKKHKQLFKLKKSTFIISFYILMIIGFGLAIVVRAMELWASLNK